MREEKICKKCGKIFPLYEFFMSNNLEKYPDGYVDECKKCMTLNVDNNKPETFLWILEELDIPYIERQWKFYRENLDLHRYSLIRRYVAYMKLAAYRNLRYKDSMWEEEQ